MAGDASAVELVRQLCERTGDDFEVVEYERRTSLSVSDSIGSLRNVEPGDAVVTFSRNDVYKIKRVIEETTPYRCCVVYGSVRRCCCCCELVLWLP